MLAGLEEGGNDNLCDPCRGSHPLTTHATDPSKLDVGTALVQCMIARDCFRSANMLIYTRCKMNHVDDTPCGNTCYNVARKQVNTEKEKHMDLYFATCKLIVLLI